MLTAERLREIVTYDAVAGTFRWREAKSGRILGGIVGGLRSGGYWHLRIDGRLYSAFQLAWLHETGSWPARRIRPRNGNRQDNRFANLLVTAPGQRAR